MCVRSHFGTEQTLLPSLPQPLGFVASGPSKAATIKSTVPPHCCEKGELLRQPAACPKTTIELLRPQQEPALQRPRQVHRHLHRDNLAMCLPPHQERLLRLLLSQVLLFSHRPLFLGKGAGGQFFHRRRNKRRRRVHIEVPQLGMDHNAER